MLFAECDCRVSLACHNGSLAAKLMHREAYRSCHCLAEWMLRGICITAGLSANPQRLIGIAEKPEGHTCIAGQPKSRRSAGTNVPAGTLALVRSPLALRCSREQNALHTLIHQRHLTPSCRGQAPTAERTLDPARMFAESLNLVSGIRVE